MRFEQALQAMREGKKVRRADWTGNYFYSLKDKKIFDNEGCRMFILTTIEVLAEDWEIVDE